MNLTITMRSQSEKGMMSAISTRFIEKSFGKVED